VLHEGDVVSVSFAGAPDLNTVAPIRRDGRITLKSFGEFKAAGLTPPEMEKELIRLYGSQLQTKEVTVGGAVVGVPGVRHGRRCLSPARSYPIGQ
jgi:protein involved in polysaccharide export with SLBB domain